MAPSSANRDPRQDSRDDTPDSLSEAAVHSDEPRINRIARRAHEIYLGRGGEHGKSLDDWLQAEREVDAAIDVPRE